MGLFTRREDLHALNTTHEARPTEGHRELVKHIDDELGFFSLGHEPRADELARQDLSSKPEDYFSCDPRHFHHEVL